MVTQNAQSEASSAWRDQENSQRQSERNQLAETGFFGDCPGGKPIGVGGNDRERGTTSSQPERKTSGGTVKQLIKETREELEETEVKLSKLHKRLNNLEQLSEELEGETKQPEQIE
jgi:hypothetical protein